MFPVWVTSMTRVSDHWLHPPEAAPAAPPEPPLPPVPPPPSDDDSLHPLASRTGKANNANRHEPKAMLCFMTNQFMQRPCQSNW